MKSEIYQSVVHQPMQLLAVTFFKVLAQNIDRDQYLIVRRANIKQAFSNDNCAVQKSFTWMLRHGSILSGCL